VTEYDKLFIGGEWVAPSSAQAITVVNASSEEVIGSVPEAQEADVDAAVDAGRAALADPDGWARWEPALVLDEAELDLATIGQKLFQATLLNNGQTCFLGTRVLAPASRYDEVVDTFAALAGSLSVGDALDPGTQIGPMASDRQRERVEGYIAKGRSEGARLVVGGARPAGRERPSAGSRPAG